MSKVDFKRELKHLYNPPKKFTIVDVPRMSFLMGDGRGDPNTSPDFQTITDALYGLAYTVKFVVKSQRDFVVPPLEGLWWMENMTAFSLEAKDEWLWTLMIMQPDWVTADVVEEALEEVGRKKDLPALPDLRFEPYDEGLAVQIMYVGPYADEGPTIARMHEFIADEGYEMAGKHHEIYLGDLRRTAPEKLKTVIRQPVRKA
jgi:hypothetical protein